MPESERESSYRSRQQKVAALVDRMSRISYFKPERTLQEANSILGQVDEIIGDYQRALERWREMGKSLFQSSHHLGYTVLGCISEEAYREACTAMSKDERDVERVRAFGDGKYGTVELVWYALKVPKDFDVVERAGEFMGRAAMWEVATDIPGFENNPYAHVLRLYEMGLNPKGFGRVIHSYPQKEEEAFIVDIPLIVDGSPILGCYAHGDGEIKFAHQWNLKCRGAHPLDPQHFRVVDV